MKTGNLILLLVLIAFFSFSTKCTDYENLIEVNNKFDFDILFIPSKDFNDDSVFFNKGVLSGNKKAYTVGANAISKIGNNPYCRQKAWLLHNIDTLVIYVLHKENALHPDIFDYESIVVKKVAITYDELINAGCSIVVEPTESKL